MKRLIAALLGILPTTLFAQAAPEQPGFFKPPADDTSVGFLRDIFGNIVDTVMAGNTEAIPVETPLAAGMQIFGTGILVLSMLFVIYTTIKGAIDTAHDGEFLGKKMSSVWVPLRTAGGTALLLPLASGFSLIQIAVLWIAIHGVGLADRVWLAMAEQMAATGMVGRPAIPDSRPLAASILRAEVCMAAMNKTYAARGDAVRVVETSSTEIVLNDGRIAIGGPISDTAQSLLTYRVETVTHSWTAQGEGGYSNPDVCGVLRWQQSHEAAEGNAEKLINKQSIVDTQAQQVTLMILGLRPIAQRIVNGEKPAAGELERLADNYERAIATAAAAVVRTANSSRDTAFLSYAESGGWIFAGTYYNHIIAMNDAVQKTINAVPAPTDASIEGKESDADLQDYRDALIVANEYIRNGSQAANRYYQSNRGNDVRRGTEAAVVDQDAKLGSWEGIKERILNQPAQWAIQQLTQEIGGSNTSHVAQMKSLGDIVMNTGYVLMGSAAVANGFAGGKASEWTVGLAWNVQAGLDPLMSVVGIIFMMMLAGGAYLAFYLPMIPYMIWISGIIKWLIVVVEMVVVAPIFAAAHIHPDGDEQVGRAGPGYMIILSVFLRPVLMLFGLVISIVVAQPIAHFINMSYMTIVQGAMGSSFNFLGGFLAYTFIYALIMTTMLHAVFSLINWLPDKALRTMGAAIDAHGIADNESKEVEHKFGAVASKTTAGMTPGKGGGGGGGERPKPKPKPMPDGGGGNDAHSAGGSGGGGGGGQATKGSANDAHSTKAPADEDST